jgi:hypothetical protein
MMETTSTNRVGDIVKLLEQYKLPGIDVAANRRHATQGLRGTDGRQSGCTGRRTIRWPKAGRNAA